MDANYKQPRLEAIEELKAAVLADDDDAYCKAYDRLLDIECTAGEFDDYAPGICRICGCTDMCGCDGGCEWVDAEHTLCSSCVDKVQPGGGTRAEAGSHDGSVADGPGAGSIPGAGAGQL